MEPKKPLLGLCPIGKFVFSHEDAVRHKLLIQKKLKELGLPFVDLEGVLEDGLVRAQSHVDKVVEHFAVQKVDCLFMPHCNFGTEGAVGMIAKKLNVPTLLWGPRDERPLADGTRLRDTLCGLFASSKVLHKLNVPFTYIENCRIDAPAFTEDIDTFVRAASVAAAFRKGIRIGQVGQRINFFWTTIINESELLEQFNIEIIPIDMVEFINAAKKRAGDKADEYGREIRKLRRDFTVEGFDKDDQPLKNLLGARDEFFELASQHQLDGFAFQPFMSFMNEMGAYSNMVASTISEEYAFALETDILGAISCIMLQRANFNSAPTFLAEFTVRHPDNENSALFWHGSAPFSMCHPDEKIRLAHHWVLPSPLSGMVHMKLKDGPFTVARFDGDHGMYKLVLGEGKTIEGPKTQNCYFWAEVDNWPRWERMLMEGPFIHHIGMAYGNSGKALIEACKYIPSLEPVILNEKL